MKATVRDVLESTIDHLRWMIRDRRWRRNDEQPKKEATVTR